MSSQGMQPVSDVTFALTLTFDLGSLKADIRAIMQLCNYAWNKLSVPVADVHPPACAQKKKDRWEGESKEKETAKVLGKALSTEERGARCVSHTFKRIPRERPWVFLQILPHVTRVIWLSSVHGRIQNQKEKNKLSKTYFPGRTSCPDFALFGIRGNATSHSWVFQDWTSDRGEDFTRDLHRNLGSFGPNLPKTAVISRWMEENRKWFPGSLEFPSRHRHNRWQTHPHWKTKKHRVSPL